MPLFKDLQILKEQIKEYQKKKNELVKEFEDVSKKIGETLSKDSALKTEYNNLFLLNDNLRKNLTDLRNDYRNLEDLIEKAKSEKIKEITKLQELLYGFEKSKQSLKNDISELVSKKERIIENVKELEKRKEELNIIQGQYNKENEKLNDIRIEIKLEKEKVGKELLRLNKEKELFLDDKKLNDKKYHEWIQLEMRVQQYARLLQNYYNEHGIRLYILDKFGIKKE